MSIREEPHGDRAEPVDEDAEVEEAGADTPPQGHGDLSDDLSSHLLDRRRPWIRPITRRDRQRRRAAFYWALLYVLLMAGVTSIVSFVLVRGYLWLWPGPTNTGAGVATQIVPWASAGVYIAFAAYVTRSWPRTVGYGLLLVSPVVVVLFLNAGTNVASWLVGWLPGGMQVYGLAALLPFAALVLLGRDFVRWQMWIEFPDDWCWECGTSLTEETWLYCPGCANDLQEQRLHAARESADTTRARAKTGRQAADEAAASD